MCETGSPHWAGSNSHFLTASRAAQIKSSPSVSVICPFDLAPLVGPTCQCVVCGVHTNLIAVANTDLIVREFPFPTPLLVRDPVTYKAAFLFAVD